jgi:hypothetical protein
MGKGSYLGGGTVIGWGQRWSDSSDFPKPENPVGELSATPKRKNRKTADRSPAQGLTQHEALKALGMTTLPPKPAKRGPILKQLVSEGILLANGRPNHRRPKIKSILEIMAKKGG